MSPGTACPLPSASGNRSGIRRIMSRIVTFTDPAAEAIAMASKTR
jgi:hypothetical protein